MGMTPLTSCPAFLCAAAAITAAPTVVSWGFVAGALIVWAVTQVITAVVLGAITVTIIKRQTRELSDAVKGLTKTIAQHEKDLGKLDKDRMRCALQSAHQYATHTEVGQVLADNSAQWMDLRNEIAMLHEKMNPIATDLAELKGKINAATN